AHKEKGLLLFQKGFEVQFFRDPEALIDEIKKHRVGIVIVGDDGPLEKMKTFINQLATLPDIQGARLLLVSSHETTELADVAAAPSFRDILPLNLDNKQWMNRFIF